MDDHTISIWAENLAKKGQSDDAVQFIINKLRHPPVTNRDCDKSLVLYNTALDICGHSGNIIQALKVFEMVRQQELEPNERTIASLLNAMAEAIKTEKVNTMEDKIKLVDQALELVNKFYSKFSEDAVCKAEPSLYIFNALLKIAGRAGRIDLVRMLFPSIQVEPSPYGKFKPACVDLVTFTTIYGVLGNLSGTFKEAQEYLQIQKGLGIPLDPICIQALLNTIKQQIDTDRNPEAILKVIEALLNEMIALQPDSSKWKISFHTVVLESLFNLKAQSAIDQYLVQHIQPLLEQPHKRFPLDDFLAGTILRIHLRSKQYSQVFAWFERYIKAKLVYPSTRMLNILLEACAREGTWGNRAISFFNNFFLNKKRNPLIPDSFTIKWLQMALDRDSTIATSQRTMYMAKVKNKYTTLFSSNNKSNNNKSKL